MRSVGAVSGELEILENFSESDRRAASGADRFVLAHGKIPARRRSEYRLAARRERRDLRVAPRTVHAAAGRNDPRRHVGAAARRLRRAPHRDGARRDCLRQFQRRQPRGIPPQSAHARRQLAAHRAIAALAVAVAQSGVVRVGVAQIPAPDRAVGADRRVVQRRAWRRAVSIARCGCCRRSPTPLRCSH